jgi:hypothetical protein
VGFQTVLALHWTDFFRDVGKSIFNIAVANSYGQASRNICAIDRFEASEAAEQLGLRKPYENIMKV